jgi:hypothetical protein
MDRVVKLAAKARKHLQFEAESQYSREVARMTTRTMLCEEAAELGFAWNEVSAAVDEALTAAGTTP